jgi:hypothetical protein
VRKLLEGEIKWENHTFSSIGSADGRNGQIMYIKDSLKCVAFLKDGVLKSELYNRNLKNQDLVNLAADPVYSAFRSEMEKAIGNWSGIK